MFHLRQNILVHPIAVLHLVVIAWSEQPETVPETNDKPVALCTEYDFCALIQAWTIGSVADFQCLWIAIPHKLCHWSADHLSPTSQCQPVALLDRPVEC